MKFNIERQQRNYNYLELIREYNLALDKYGFNKSFNKRDFYELTKNIKGFDSADEIFEALIPNNDDIENPNKLELFYEIGQNEYGFSKNRKIKLTATKEEAVVVYSMLNNGDFDLFFDKTEVVKSNLEKYFENLDLLPLDINSYIETKGQSKCADCLSDIKENFEMLKTAIKEKRFVHFVYQKGNDPITLCVFPVEIIFSQLDERFRLKSICDDNRFRTFYISYMSNLRLLDDKPFILSALEEKQKELVFQFCNEKGLEERVCARFSNYEKQVHFDKNKNVIIYRLKYNDNPLESSRIISRLLSLGSNVQILSNERKTVCEIAKKALALYR